MCSCRTYVPVIACLTIPGLELKAALQRTPTLALRPAALAPEPQGEPLIGPVTANAQGEGGGARHVPVARAHRARRGRCGARLGGDRPLPRGRGLRRRSCLARRRVTR